MTIVHMRFIAGYLKPVVDEPTEPATEPGTEGEPVTEFPASLLLLSPIDTDMSKLLLSSVDELAPPTYLALEGEIPTDG